MKKTITKNYIYNLIYQILLIVLPLITTPYISRVLGAINIGIYGYTLSISAYFILFGSLGIALYGQREIAFVQNDKKKYSIMFWEIVLLRIFTMTISLLIFIALFTINGEYSIYYRILILELIGNAIDISWFFQGLEEFKKTVSRNIIVKLISVICIFAFVKSQNDLFIYFLIYVLSLILGNLSLWFYLPKFIEKISIKQINIWQHLKPTFVLYIPQIAVQIYTLLDKTMIGTIVLDKSEVGYYEQSQKIIKILLTIVTSLGTVMLPRIANAFANDKKTEIKQYMTKSFNMVFILAFPIIFGLIAVSDTFVPIFFGSGYYKVSMLIKIISPVILFIGLSNVTGIQYLLPTKRQREYTISVICGAIINFIFNLIMIPMYGAIGAAIGTILAESLVTLVQILFTKKDFDYFQVFKLTFNYIVASIIMFVVCICIGKSIGNGAMQMMLQIIIGTITYFGTLLILKDKFVLDIVKKIKNKI